MFFSYLLFLVTASKVRKFRLSEQERNSFLSSSVRNLSNKRAERKANNEDEPRRGGQSTGRWWSAKHGTPAKCMVGQQPRRGGRMTTSYTSYRCSVTPSGLLISYHRQAGVTLRSTTCLWSSQPFGLHFTTGCHTKQALVLYGIFTSET